ncbi:major facilitator superfamily domain-containing protein [Xylaria bambusicola]|uniref:major facilitator superfamily domain-containing protein n=1 Tax=Xylaria bambusicola TaxID=326684 RepID=UPI002007C4F7|nr:major facilitator superfamily domain-containing protein [Xylaria bambusicola]KAI0514542.1 major facilitator superfamily domain-containing protein [Xylaria bambusicola]
MPEYNTTIQSSQEDQLGHEKVKPTSPESSSHDESRRGSKLSQSIHSSGDSEDIDDVDQQDRLERCSTKHSAMGDASIQPIESVVQVPEEFYDKLPKHRKTIILFLISFSSFLSPISSTSVLAATPEVAAEYHTTGSIVNLVNALYLLFMGLSPIVWGPLSQVYGRRIVCLVTGTGFVLASIGTALSPNLGAFFFFRLFTAFLGTSFLLNGAAVISDIYKPTERGTATGWFMSGTLIGPAFGPFLGGLIVTYTSWRVIFWLQTGLAGIGTIGIFFFMPETIFHKKIDDLQGYSGREKGRALLSMLNPWGILKLFRYPNFILAGFASSSLVWNMYSILTPIRYVLNPRYHLTTPLQGGLFYLAPGFGYLTGTFVGGRYADYIVKVYIRKRGVRIPEDRMYSALPFLGFVLPGSVIIYGWCVEKDAGGIPLTVIVLFLQGLAQLFCFPSLNTYCLDVMSGRGAEVIAGNYAIRYLFGCVATAVVLPAIQSIGVGWFSTISTLFLLAGAVCTYLTVRYGEQWRNDIDAKHKMNKLKRRKDTNNGASHMSTEKPANSSEV